MPSGVVKWFSREKGYGFIVPEGNTGQKDVFVHHSGILMTGYRFLETGQRVSFKAKESDDGPMAYDVIVQQEQAGERRVCPTCHQEIVAKEEGPETEG